MSAQPSPRAAELGLVLCQTCGLVCEDTLAQAPDSDCPRCGAPLRRRRRDSISRAWAYLLAAMVFYLPANLLPVMWTEQFRSGHDSTIIGGVGEFWGQGSYGIALVIFVASVAVPCAKFLIMSVLLLSTQRRSRWRMRERAGLYRLVELIGYWSMLDVLVVGMVTALVKFQSLTDVEPRIGILFFGVVVILTMLSAMSFDPRLIWDVPPDE